MAEDFKSYAAREMLLAEARKKKDDEGVSILQLRKFILQMLNFTSDRELRKLIVGFHNVLARMESRRGPKPPMTVHSRKSKR